MSLYIMYMTPLIRYSNTDTHPGVLHDKKLPAQSNCITLSRFPANAIVVPIARAGHTTEIEIAGMAFREVVREISSGLLIHLLSRRQLRILKNYIKNE